MWRTCLLSILALALLAPPVPAAPRGDRPPPKELPFFKKLFQPNLVVEAIEILEKPGGVIQGQLDFPLLRVRVRNTGILPASASFLGLAVFIDGTPVAVPPQPVPLLLGGGSYELEVSLGEVPTDTLQSYWAMAYADVLGHVTESSETDNALSASAVL